MPEVTEAAAHATGNPSIESILGIGEEHSAPTPGAVAPAEPGQAAQPFKVAGREWKSQQEFEGSYKQLLGGYSKSQQKAKILESIMARPEFAQAIKDDPELAEAAAKAGLQMIEDEREKREEEDDEGGERSLQEIVQQQGLQIATMQYREEFRRDREELENELKRPLSQAEKSAIVKLMGDVPSLSPRQAYRLAHFDDLRKEAFEKGKSEARPYGGRPAAPPGMLPGQALNLKKPVTQMNRMEHREDLRQALRSGVVN